MIFKLMALVAVIYVIFRYQEIKKLGTRKQEEDPGEEFVDYEEID